MRTGIRVYAEVPATVAESGVEIKVNFKVGLIGNAFKVGWGGVVAVAGAGSRA